MKELYKYKYTIITALVILILTIIPGSTVRSTGLNKESYHIKGHFIAYLILVIALYKGTKDNLISGMISVMYGILMELLQKLVPGRAFEYSDIAVNSFGSVLALLIIWKRSLILPKKLKNWLDN